MRAILIDDERPSLRFLEGQCVQAGSVEVVGSFQSAPEALDFLANNQVDLVLTDIEMPGLSGMEAVRRLRASQSDIGVIIVTGYEDHAFEAFSLDAVAYLLKPCKVEELKRAVSKAARLMPARKKISFRTFGPFTMLVEGAPYRFSNSKAKELLALLVDRRGSVVTMEEAAGILWEDRPYDNHVKQIYRKLTSYLNQVMRETAGDFLIVNRGSCHIVPDRVECDYFLLLGGDHKALREYGGEYMSEYSWAEVTVAKLDRFARYEEA